MVSALDHPLEFPWVDIENTQVVQIPLLSRSYGFKRPYLIDFSLAYSVNKVFGLFGTSYWGSKYPKVGPIYLVSLSSRVGIIYILGSPEVCSRAGVYTLEPPP